MIPWWAEPCDAAEARSCMANKSINGCVCTACRIGSANAPPMSHHRVNEPPTFCAPETTPCRGTAYASCHCTAHASSFARQPLQLNLCNSTPDPPCLWPLAEAPR